MVTEGPGNQTAEMIDVTSEAKVNCVVSGLNQPPSIKVPFAIAFHQLFTKGKSLCFRKLLIIAEKPFIVAIIARINWFVEAGPLHQQLCLFTTELLSDVVAAVFVTDSNLSDVTV